jgi:hypothetical protein
MLDYTVQPDVLVCNGGGIDKCGCGDDSAAAVLLARGVDRGAALPLIVVGRRRFAVAASLRQHPVHVLDRPGTYFERVGRLVREVLARPDHCCTQVNNGTTQVGAGVIWNMTTPAHSSAAPFITSGRFPGVRLGVDGGLSPACFNHAAPDFRPTGVATLAGGQLAPIQPPNDGFFQAVTFIGAVGPNDDWTAGWTAYPQN